MAVNEDLSAYSTTAASNTPAGGSNIGPDLDNHLRDIKRNVRRVAERYQGTTTPEAFRGREWIDTSATASTKLEVKLNDGSNEVVITEIDTSAGTSTPVVHGTAIPKGSMAVQAANAVNIDGGTIDGTPIGGTTPSTGAFTTLEATGATTIVDGTAAQHPASLSQLQAGGPFYYAATGTNTITATPSPALTAYAEGQTVTLKIATTNTGAATLNLNSLGAKTVKTQDGGALIGGELVGIHKFVYDGTDFVVSDPYRSLHVFRAVLSFNQTVTTSTWTKMALATEETDTHGEFDTTLYRYTPTVAGYYLLTVIGAMTTTVDNKVLQLSIRKNGVDVRQSRNTGHTASAPRALVTAVVYLNGSTDYVEAFAQHTLGFNADLTSLSSATGFEGVGPF